MKVECTEIDDRLFYFGDAQANTCLANQAEVNRLVQMQSDAVNDFNVPGTPAFLINGDLVENASSWEALEPEIRKALR